MSFSIWSLRNKLDYAFSTEHERELVAVSKEKKEEIEKDFQVHLADNNARFALKFWIWLSLIVEILRVCIGSWRAVVESSENSEILWYYVALYGIVLFNTIIAVPGALFFKKNIKKYHNRFQFCVEVYMLVYLIRGVCFMALDIEYGLIGFSLIVAMFIAGYSLYIRPSSSIFNMVVTMLMLLAFTLFVNKSELYDMRMYFRIFIVAILSCSTAVIRYNSKFKTYLIERNIIAQRDALELLNEQVKKSKEQIEMQNRKLQVISVTDTLTGLYNRRAFLNRSEEYISNSVENGSFITVAAIDIDDFKKINDTIGHMSGDICIMSVAKLLKEINSDEITCYRMGGDEFTVVFEGKSKSEAFLIMDKVLKKVAMINLKDYYETITLSVGIYSNVANEKDIMDIYLEKADILLYKAKANGKNRIEY